MSIDINLYNYVGPDYDGITLDERDKTFGRTETGDWADTLKHSTRLSGFTHFVGRVYGGKEDCADFNNGCSNCRLEADEFHSGGKYVTTVKDCAGIEIRGKIVNGGSEVDHDFGNWSDQGSTRTTGCVLGTWYEDRRPVTVRCLNADKPMEVPGTGPYVYLFPKPDAWYHGIVVWLFLTSRRLKLWR